MSASSLGNPALDAHSEIDFVMVDESLPVGQFADITIGDWRGYDLVVAR